MICRIKSNYCTNISNNSSSSYSSISPSEYLTLYIYLFLTFVLPITLPSNTPYPSKFFLTLAPIQSPSSMSSSSHRIPIHRPCEPSPLQYIDHASAHPFTTSTMRSLTPSIHRPCEPSPLQYIDHASPHPFNTSTMRALTPSCESGWVGDMRVC